MRTTIIEGANALAVVDYENRAMATVYDKTPLRPQLLEGSCAYEILVRGVHEKTSVIPNVGPARAAAYISAAASTEGTPFSADLMQMWPISTRVNKPENDDPSITEPIELATDVA
jgi:hypothetical protein